MFWTVTFPQRPDFYRLNGLSALFVHISRLNPDNISYQTTHQVDVARTFLRLSHYAPLLRLINESTVEPTGDSSMKVLIAGATGVLGRRLVQPLRDRGHSAIAALVRVI